MRIQDFQPIISHCPGTLNVVAGALSRAPVGEPEPEDPKGVMDSPSGHLNILSALTSTIDVDKLRAATTNDEEIKKLIEDLPTGFVLDSGILYKVSKHEKRLIYMCTTSIAL